MDVDSDCVGQAVWLRMLPLGVVSCITTLKACAIIFNCVTTLEASGASFVATTKARQTPRCVAARGTLVRRQSFCP